MTRLSLIVAALWMAGCAALDPNTLTVKYDSVPRGAMLYENGRPVGIMPQVLHYQISPEAKAAGSMNLQDTNARWASGAATPSKSQKPNLARDGNQQYVTFYRPDNAPNLDVDMRFALEFERTKAAKEQADAADYANILNMYNAMMAPASNTYAPRDMYCTPNAIGQLVCRQ